MRFISRCFFTLLMSLLVAAAIQVHRPVSWSHFQGLEDPKPVRNLAEAMEQSLLKKESELSFSESEINRYLAKNLDFQSHGPFSHAYQLQKVGVDLKPDLIEIGFQWSFLERWTSTASVQLKLHRVEKQYLISPVGGQFGRLSVPAGFAAILSPSLESLANAMSGELKELFKMQDIRFQEGKLVLHPIHEQKSASSR